MGATDSEMKAFLSRIELRQYILEHVDSLKKIIRTHKIRVKLTRRENCTV